MPLHVAVGIVDEEGSAESYDMARLLVSRGASLYVRDEDGHDAVDVAQMTGYRRTANFLGAVREPREQLIALRRELPTRRRHSPCRARVQARLFLDVQVPDDVFAHVLAFWRSDRDD